LAVKQSRFSEQQIAFILHQAEAGVAVEEVCRKAGISIQTYYRWRKKYGGLMPSEMKRLKLLEEENARLKRLVADLSLDKVMLQDVVWEHGEFVADPKSQLIWCPNNGRQRIAKFIDAAKEKLWIQNERYQDTVIIERLVRAARRGVKVHVLAKPPHTLKADKLIEGVGGRFCRKVPSTAQIATTQDHEINGI
jgi:putative transposase